MSWPFDDEPEDTAWAVGELLGGLGVCAVIGYAVYLLVNSLI